MRSRSRLRSAGWALALLLAVVGPSRAPAPEANRQVAERYASGAGEPFNRFSGSTSFAYALSERFGSYLETFGFVPGGEDGPNTTFLNGGVTYLVSPGLQLDARVGTGMGAAEADIFVGIGLSKRW